MYFLQINMTSYVIKHTCVCTITFPDQLWDLVNL